MSYTYTDLYKCQLEITIPVTIVVLLLPNLISLLISLITKTKTSKILAVLNMLQNILLGIAIGHGICAKYLMAADWGYLSGFFFSTFIFFGISTGLFSGYCCPFLSPTRKLNQHKRKIIIQTHEKMKKNGIKSPEEYGKKCCTYWFSPEDMLAAQREMRMPRVSREKLENLMRKNEERPPNPIVESQAYYYTCCKCKRVEVETQSSTVKYQTWEEENEPVKMGTKPIQVYYCNVEYDYDEELQQTIEELKEKEKSKLLKWEYESVEFIDPNKNKITTDIIAADDSCAEKCCRPYICCASCFVVALFIGYGYPVTLWWRMQTDVIVFNSKKRMSSKRDLKANYNERLNENHENEEMNEEIMEP